MADGVSSDHRSLVLATRNPHKVAEMRRLFEPSGITIELLDPEVVLPAEDGLDVRGQRPAQGAGGRRRDRTGVDRR